MNGLKILILKIGYKDINKTHHVDFVNVIKTFSAADQGVKQLYFHMNSDKHEKRSPADATDKSQNKQKQMAVNFIPVDKLGHASESTSTSSASKMNTLKQSSINTVSQKDE